MGRYEKGRTLILVHSYYTCSCPCLVPCLFTTRTVHHTLFITSCSPHVLFTTWPVHHMTCSSHFLFTTCPVHHISCSSHGLFTTYPVHHMSYSSHGLFITCLVHHIACSSQTLFITWQFITDCSSQFVHHTTLSFKSWELRLTRAYSWIHTPLFV